MPDRAPDAARHQWLLQEINSWRSEELIDARQAEILASRYEDGADGAAPGAGGREPSVRLRLTLTLAILGSLLVGAGVVLFFAANWRSIPPFVKLASVYGSIVASHLLGYYLGHARGTYPRLGQALVFLGCLLFGAGIWLVAQIYNISAHFPTGLLLWALGTLAMAAALRHKPVLILATGLLVAWTASEQVGFGAPNYLYPALAAVALALAYRLHCGVSVGLNLAGVTGWLTLNVINWGGRGAPPLGMGTLIVAGTAWFAFGLWHDVSDRTRPLGLPYLWVGALATLGGLYGLTFRYPAPVLAPASPGLGLTRLVNPPLAAVVVLAVAALAAAHLAGRRRVVRGALTEALPIPVLLASAALAWSPTREPWLLVCFNALLFLAVVGLLAFGYRHGRPHLINLALVAFVVDLITRYVDVFWTMLDRSLFFVAGGALLLAGGALLERGRRRLVGQFGDRVSAGGGRR